VPAGNYSVPPDPSEIPVKEGVIRFADLDIAPEILHALRDLQFHYCTPIQECSLPNALTGRDVGGKAQTGTGKTAAFLISAFSRMLRTPAPAGRRAGMPRAIVLAPTRELAVQICEDAHDLAKYSGLHNLVVYGGVDYDKQKRALNRPVDLLVATPGRLLDYVGNRIIDLSMTEILIIDEADRMLDMGFIPDVRRIVSRLPPTGQRQTMLYSATLTPEVLRLVQSWMTNPEMVEVHPERVVTELVDQVFYSVLSEDRLALLVWLIQHDNVERMLVFGNRRDTTDRLAHELEDYGITCGLLSGDVPQKKRMRILEEFRNGKLPIIVATDVAARGIHVDSVSHVVNFDMPYEPADYVHRIGRTGRAGETGKSVSFASEFGAYIIPDLEALLGHSINTVQVTDDMLVLPERLGHSADALRPRRSGGGGGGGPRRGGGGGRGGPSRGGPRRPRR